MWVGTFRLSILWSCSINSWLDVILMYTFFPSFPLCLVTKVCRQVLFEWIVWTAWIVLIAYSPSLHWRWVCQRTFRGCLYCVHCLFRGKDRKESVSLSDRSLSCQLCDTEWYGLEYLNWGQKAKIHLRTMMMFLLLLYLIQVLLAQLESLGLNSKSVIERFVESYKAMWTVNGHNLSRVFTGSRALEGKHKVKKNGKIVYSQVKEDDWFALQCHLHWWFLSDVGWETQGWRPLSVSHHSVKFFWCSKAGSHQVAAHGWLLQWGICRQSQDAHGQHCPAR